jgi:hypothetical protein
MPVDYIADAGRKAKGKRPQFFDNPESERLMGILMAVVEELAVTRERLDTVERLLESTGSLDRSAIDSFHPDKDAAMERGLMNQEYIARVLRILQQEREALEESLRSGQEKPLSEVSAELGTA